MENKSSHSSYDEGESSRLPPSNIDNLSHEFDKLRICLVQENQNLNSVTLVLRLLISLLLMFIITFSSCMVYLTLLILILILL
jgi:hypothetical protein